MRSTHPLRVLVADEHADVVDSTVTLLELHGFAAAAADPPDVALVDLGMPGLDGFEVARRLRRLPASPFLVAVTGRTAAWDQQQAALAGFGVYLTKPVPPDDLVDLLRACDLARRQPG